MNVLATFEKEVDAHKNSSFVISYKIRTTGALVVFRKKELTSLDKQFQESLINRTNFKLISLDVNNNDECEIHVLSKKDGDVIMAIPLKNGESLLQELKEELIKNL